MVARNRLAEVIRPDFSFPREVEICSGQPIRGCSRCHLCTERCPVSPEMDYPPDRMIQLARLGLRDRLLGSDAIWLCTWCDACAGVCPERIDVSAVVRCLQGMAWRRGYRREAATGTQLGSVCNGRGRLLLGLVGEGRTGISSLPSFSLVLHPQWILDRLAALLRALPLAFRPHRTARSDGSWPPMEPDAEHSPQGRNETG